MDPEQSAPIGFLNNSADEKAVDFVAIGALRVKSAQKIFMFFLSLATSAGAG